MNRQDLVPVVIDALKDAGGSARLKDIAKFVWDHHENRLRRSGDFFYSWQYKLRWAGDSLVRSGKILKGPPVGTWHLK